MTTRRVGVDRKIGKGPELVVRDGIVMEQRNVIAVRLGSVANKISLLSNASSAVACSPPHISLQWLAHLPRLLSRGSFTSNASLAGARSSPTPPCSHLEDPDSNNELDGEPGFLNAVRFG